MIWLAAAAWGADCASTDDPCACEEERARSVARALEPLEAFPTAHQSAAAWRTTAAATCSWAESIASAPGSGCLPTASCVRLLAEDRLETLASAAPPARAADLERLTGRVGCTAEAGPACAIDARRAEEERLVALVRALAALHLDPHDAERYWLGYRDSACIDESRSSGVDLGWAQSACEAVRTQRRADLLAELAGIANPAAAVPLSEARLAGSAAEVHGRPWRRWLAAAGDTPGAREALREAVEARADGAVYPPLLATAAWSACATPGSAECWAQVGAETRSQRDAAAPPLVGEAEEQAWRARWCARGTPADQAGCQAAVDLIVVAAHASSR